MFPTSTVSLSGRTRVNPSSDGEMESRRAVFERRAQQRTQQVQVFVASTCPCHHTIRSNAYIIVARRCLRRNISCIKIALDQLQRTFGWRPVAAATSFDADQISRRQPEGFLLLDRSHGAGFAIDDREAAGPALVAALHPPGRKACAVEVGLQ